MKVSEIEVEKIYTNGKNRESQRVVLKIEENPHYYDDPPVPCVFFKGIKGKYVGLESWITLKSFAKWAKAEVQEG